MDMISGRDWFWVALGIGGVYYISRIVSFPGKVYEGTKAIAEKVKEGITFDPADLGKTPKFTPEAKEKMREYLEKGYIRLRLMDPTAPTWESMYKIEFTPKGERYIASQR